MWRLKVWLCRLGVWLWFRFGEEKSYLAFRHIACGSEEVQLAHFRPWATAEPEFQCFECGALVPAKNITFRLLSSKEVEVYLKGQPSQIVLPHVVTT